ncbi:MAG: hypothetical protein EXS64_00345 [Candidatus Latescibacteria bacterium]|nr:hypothetical protein [Candidatus Latescibacterota bacterium]
MTEAQRMDYEAQGYLVVEGGFAPDALKRAHAAFDGAEASGGLEDLPNRDDLFIHLAEHPIFFSMIHRIVGDDVQLRSLRGVRVTPVSAGRGWRREVAGLVGVHHPASTFSVQMSLYLDDAPEEGACIAVVPGSHRFKSDLPFPDITTIEDMPHHVVLRAKAGTAILLNGNLWQARTRNRSSASQRFLEYTYVHCWMRQVLPPLSPHATEVASSAHNLSQLFGIRTGVPDSKWYWGRRVEGYPSSAGLPERQFSALKVVGRGTPNA